MLADTGKSHHQHAEVEAPRRSSLRWARTAILGLLPAALSTKIGSQTAQPLAIVVVGGMTLTLFVDRYLMPVLYSFYGNRELPAGGGNLPSEMKNRSATRRVKIFGQKRSYHAGQKLHSGKCSRAGARPRFLIRCIFSNAY